MTVFIQLENTSYKLKIESYIVKTGPNIIMSIFFSLRCPCLSFIKKEFSDLREWSYWLYEVLIHQTGEVICFPNR